MKIFDAHNDFLTELNKVQRKAYISWVEKYCKKTKIIAQVWTTELTHPMRTIQQLKKEVEGKKNFIFSIEDLGFLGKKNFKERLEVIITQKPFSCGLVWNNDNILGGGALGQSGLTKLGEHVVKRLEESGIIIDTAHMNEVTFWDFCKITTKPIFNSHCNIFDLCHHPRNLKDEQIKAIVDSGGIVCLSFVSYFIKEKRRVSCSDIAEQIKWFIKKYGDKNIGIGSDFFGTSELPLDLKTYVNFDNLKSALHKVGLNSRQINNIFYGNLTRFLRKVGK
ncbi:MAG: dipeptidase [Christensenellales bacterium]